MEFDVLAIVLCCYLLLIQKPNVTRAKTIFTLISCSAPLSGKARDDYCNARCKKMGYEGGTCNNERGDVCDCEALQASNTVIYTTAEVSPRSVNTTTKKSISNFTRNISDTTVATTSGEDTLASRIHEISHPASLKILTLTPINAQTISVKVATIPAVTNAYYKASSVKIKYANPLNSNNPFPNAATPTNVINSSLTPVPYIFTLSRTDVSVKMEHSSTLSRAQATPLTTISDTKENTYLSASITNNITNSPRMTTPAFFTQSNSGNSAKNKRYSAFSHVTSMPNKLMTIGVAQNSSTAINDGRSPTFISATSVPIGVPRASNNTSTSNYIRSMTVKDQNNSVATTDASSSSVSSATTILL